MTVYGVTDFSVTDCSVTDCSVTSNLLQVLVKIRVVPQLELKITGYQQTFSASDVQKWDGRFIMYGARKYHDFNSLEFALCRTEGPYVLIGHG